MILLVGFPPVAGAGFDSDQNRRRTSLCGRLQRGGELETVPRENTIIMVRGRDKVGGYFVPGSIL